MTSASRWRAVHASDGPATAVRLFCLPYAGGGASLFKPWAGLLPPAIQVCPIQLPGREERLGERLHTSLPRVVDELVPALLPLVDRRFALFGHSMGAVVAFELARELRRLGAPPAWLFVAACRAPHRQAESTTRLSVLSDSMLVDAVQRKYGGIPDAVLQEPELLALLVPVLRADLSVFENYHYREEPSLECPISAFGGVHDRAVAEQDLWTWKEQTVGSFECRMLPGSHFFVKDSRAELLAVIAERLHSVR